MFGGAVIAGATLDRLLHHSITINIKGESFRLKEKLKAGLLKPKLDSQPAPSTGWFSYEAARGRIPIGVNLRPRRWAEGEGELDGRKRSASTEAGAPGYPALARIFSGRGEAQSPLQEQFEKSAALRAG